MDTLTTERHLLAVAVALGASEVRGWSPAEESLTNDLPTIPRSIIRRVRRRIADGRDPLGRLFCTLRTPDDRRPSGATYTPSMIVRAMVKWSAKRDGQPARVIDPGVGSARFLVAAGR